jgi:hypothetical protein
LHIYGHMLHTLIRLCFWKEDGDDSMVEATWRPVLLDRTRLCPRWVYMGRPLKNAHWWCPPSSGALEETTGQSLETTHLGIILSSPGRCGASIGAVNMLTSMLRLWCSF